MDAHDDVKIRGLNGAIIHVIELANGATHQRSSPQDGEPDDTDAVSYKLPSNEKAPHT